MTKVMVILGTRPEAVKLAPVIKALEIAPDFDLKVCLTAQHRQMLDQVMDLFEIKADYDLDLMKPNQTLPELTSRLMLSLQPVLKEEKPDLVIVQGDTTTVMTAALAAFYQQIKIGHVEAGLRTYQKFSPFPEEVNRQITSVLADYHFAPTEESANNLKSEKVNPELITITGNTVIDALFMTVDKLSRDDYQASEAVTQVRSLIKKQKEQGRERIVLITGHRRENFGQGFENICQSIKHLACDNPNTAFIYPVHLNPQVQKPVNEYLSNLDNVELIAPLDYEPFIELMRNSYLILTDSGGVQEEAPSLGKPVLVMRENTERPEAVKAGTVKLVGTDQEKIYQSVNELLNNRDTYQKMSQAHNPYGDGKATGRILDFIRKQINR